MFKKLKDKLDVNSPLKSVQQFASAVVSPSSSSVFEPSSNDQFCIDDCDDENQDTVQSSPAKANTSGFTTVNLQGQISSSSPLQEPQRSRRSSVSSVTSDTSSLFPRYEPSTFHFQLQSDLESASEVEDSISLQLERISKENLYEAYRKLRMRYNKYKGRFVDLAEHYKRLEKENSKCKNILSETQDKALRRIGELKEQCTLEQEAKAHLEEALRSDLEEKDHLISTLNTKIELLKTGNSIEEVQSVDHGKVTENKTTSEHSPESDQLAASQDKVKKLELLLMKCKNSITEKNELIEKQHKEIASNEEKTVALTGDLAAVRNEIERLNSLVDSLKRNEEEATLSLAENKLVIHQELEKKDEQIKTFKQKIEQVNKENSELNDAIKQLKNDFKVSNDHGKETASGDENIDFIQELYRGKSEAVKLMQQKLVTVEEDLNYRLKSKDTEIEKILLENVILKKRIGELEQAYSTAGSKYSNLDVKTNDDSGNIAADGQSSGCNNKDCQLKLQQEILCKGILTSQLADKDSIIERIKNSRKIAFDEFDAKVKSLTENYKEIDEKYKNLREINKQLSSERESLQNEIINIEKSNQCYNKNIKVLSDEILLLKDDNSNKTKELQNVKDVTTTLNEKENDIIHKLKMINDLENLISTKDEEISAQKIVHDKEISDKHNDIKCLQTLVDKTNEELTHKNSQLQQISQKLDDMYKEKTLLEEQLNTKQKENLESENIFKEKQLSYENRIKESDSLISRYESQIDKKEQVLKKKQFEIEEFKAQLKDTNVEISEMKKKLLTENEVSDKKKVYFLNLFSEMKREISNSNVLSESLACVNHSSDLEEELQEEIKLLLSTVNEFKKMLNDKDSKIKKLSIDLKLVNDDLTTQKLQLTNLSSKSCTECTKKHALLEKIMKEKSNLKEIKVIKNELSSFVNTCMTDVKQNLFLVSNETEKLKTYQSLEVQQKEFKENVSKLESEIKERNKELKELSETKLALERLENDKSNFESEKLNFSQKMMSLENEISSLKSSCGELKGKLNSEKNKCLKLETELKENVDNLNNELTKFKSEMIVIERDHKTALEAKDRELSSLIDELVMKDNRIHEEITNREKEIENLKIKLQNVEMEQNKLSNNADKEICDLKMDFASTRKQLEVELDLRNSEINNCKVVSKKMENELKEIKNCINIITSEKNAIEEECESIRIENSRLKNVVTNLEQNVNEKDIAVKDLKVKFDELKVNSEAIIAKHQKELNQLEMDHKKCISDDISIVDAKYVSEIATLKESLWLVKNEAGELKNKLCEYDLNIENVTSKCEQLKRINEDYCKRIEDLTEQIETKESISVGSSDKNKFTGSEIENIRKENEEYKLKLSDLEERQVDKIKDLLFDFNLKLLQKDEEIRSIENYNFDKKQAEEDFVVLEFKQQIKDLQHELELRGDAYEKLLEEHQEIKKSADRRITEFEAQHETDLRDRDMKWRMCLDRRLVETESHYKEEIDELSNEWKKERKSEIKDKKDSGIEIEELECSNRLAVAAMESGVSSAEMLRKQITALTQQLDDEKRQYKREVGELQRLLVLKKHTKKTKSQELSAEDCTEMEYLKNILYEYMMGKEPLVLAKVLSAIVKFDPDQTSKVLQKEEQKLSLLGQLHLA